MTTMKAAGSTLTYGELLDVTGFPSPNTPVQVEYADGGLADIVSVEHSASGILLTTDTDSIQEAMNDAVTALEAITNLPKKGGRQAVMDAVGKLLEELEKWTT